MGRRPLFIVPPITLDRTAQTSLQRQLCRQLGQAIRSGDIDRGARIPSTRLMAKLLCVSRNTVLSAYDELVADGLLLSERGAGMRVSGAVPVRGLTLSGLRHVIRAANFPARVLPLADPDGNLLYINVK